MKANINFAYFLNEGERENGQKRNQKLKQIKVKYS